MTHINNTEVEAPNVEVKSIMVDSKTEVASSAQIESIGEVIESLGLGDKVIRPPYDLESLIEVSGLSTRVARSAKIWATNTVGMGWEVIASDNEGKRMDLSEMSGSEASKFKSEKTDLLELFTFPNAEMPFVELMRRIKVDEELTGNGYLEIVRNNIGKIVSLYHVPSHTVRVLANGTGFVQVSETNVSMIPGVDTLQRSIKVRYFKHFGQLNSMDATSGRSRKRVTARKRATELIHFKVYAAGQSKYGVPRWITASPAITGNRLSAERNVSFIENDAPLPLSSSVVTPDGMRRFGDLKVGDLVTGQDGLGHKVTEILPSGNQDVYKVTFKDGGSAECTLDHTWTVSNAYDRRRGITRDMSLKDILDEGISYDSGCYKWAVPITDPVQFSNSGDLKIDPYLMGLLLGDGYMCGDVVTLAYHNDDLEELLDTLDNTLTDNMNYRVKVRDWANGGEIYLRRPRGVYRNALRTYLKELDLIDKNCYNKFIPLDYLRSSVEDRISVLQGLMDSDGHIGDTFVRYTTMSRELAEGVVELSLSLGCLATVHTCKTRGIFNVLIKQIPEHIIPARLSRKVKAYFPHNTLRTRTIHSIEPSGSKEVQCIRVDNDDSLFLTNDYIVTHNCPRLAVMVEGGQIGPDGIDSISEFFREMSQGPENASRVLVIQTEAQKTALGQDKSAKIRLQPLTVGVIDDASFQTYRASNDEEIRESTGIAEVFFRSDNVNRSASEVGRSTTNEQEFAPDRRLKEFLLNHTVIADNNWSNGPMKFAKLMFKVPTIIDPMDQSMIDNTYSQNAAITINELRTNQGKDPFDQEWAEEPLLVMMAKLEVAQVALSGGVVTPILTELLGLTASDAKTLADSLRPSPAEPTNSNNDSKSKSSKKDNKSIDFNSVTEGLRNAGDRIDKSKSNGAMEEVLSRFQELSDSLAASVKGINKSRRLAGITDEE